jgi:hypothetical protein
MPPANPVELSRFEFELDQASLGREANAAIQNFNGLGVM